MLTGLTNNSEMGPVSGVGVCGGAEATAGDQEGTEAREGKCVRR